MPCKKTKRKRKLDPVKLPKPNDFRGFDHTLVRIVPKIDKLIEAQIVLPAHIFDDIADVLEKESFKDVEIDRKVGRIVRRGKKNKATNIFMDRER